MLSALPGVNDYVKAARRLGLRLAVVSSSGHAWVEGYLRHFGLFDDYEVIICREDVRSIKPDPELFRGALDMLKLRADETLVLEDSPTACLLPAEQGCAWFRSPTPSQPTG